MMIDRSIEGSVVLICFSRVLIWGPLYTSLLHSRSRMRRGGGPQKIKRNPKLGRWENGGGGALHWRGTYRARIAAHGRGAPRYTGRKDPWQTDMVSLMHRPPKWELEALKKKHPGWFGQDGVYGGVGRSYEFARFEGNFVVFYVVC